MEQLFYIYEIHTIVNWSSQGIEDRQGQEYDPKMEVHFASEAIVVCIVLQK